MQNLSPKNITRSDMKLSNGNKSIKGSIINGELNSMYLLIFMRVLETGTVEQCQCKGFEPTIYVFNAANERHGLPNA